MRDEDTFVLSKGHAVAALYALLAEVNALDPRELDSFYGEGTRFPALPPVNTIKEIPFATGSLGHGLSLCAGMALGAILNRRDRRFFCLTSDGELDAGEHLGGGPVHCPSQADQRRVAHRSQPHPGHRRDRGGAGPRAARRQARRIRLPGRRRRRARFHLPADRARRVLARSEGQAGRQQGRPVAIIANTIKGHGVRYMQDTVASHYLPMDDAQYEQALDELSLAHAAAVAGARDAG